MCGLRRFTVQFGAPQQIDSSQINMHDYVHTSELNLVQIKNTSI